MGASITLAGESLIAQKHAAQQGLNLVRFIFANVPGLDPSGPVDRAAPKPAAGQIVHIYDIPGGNAGYVNPNQVVYSSQIGSDVGDWDFNWIGLETADGVLFAVAYVPLQIKRRNIPPLQVGNNLTRNFLVAFDGAQALTGISIDASTWQHDFTVRLAGIDERERLSNRDIYGRACFFGSSFQLEKIGSAYQLKPGVAYVEGVRLQRTAALPVVPPVFPTTAWLDVSLQRELSDVQANWSVVWGAGKTDYLDSAGVPHYLVAIADLPNGNTLTDRRPVEPINGPLVGMFALRNGDYEDLRARATTKDDVDLGNLPNAKGDDPDADDSQILATTKATKKAKQDVLAVMIGQIAMFAMATPPSGWLKCNGATVSRATYADLFARIGTTYGAGNGSTTFALPDLRGEFIRGWDDGRGVDSARQLGSQQLSQNLSHAHSINDPGHDHTYGKQDWGAGVSSGGSYLVGAPQQINTLGSYTGITIQNSGGTEARPRNVAALICIRY